MAKKERKRSIDKTTVVGSLGAELLGLAPPFGAAPYRPGKHCLYVRKGSNLMVVVFAATYSAKKFIDILLEEDTIAKTRSLNGLPTTIVSSSDIRITCDEIDEILEHKYSSREEEWELGEPDRTNAMRFRNSSGYEESAEIAHNRQDGERAPREKKEKVEKTAKPSKEGLVTIAEIAAELKIEPRDARAALRSAKVEKPVVGWAWAKGEVDKIKKIVQDNK